MTYFIFIGDMLVMLFMVGVAVWVSCYSSKEDIAESARIPLDDDESPCNNTPPTSDRPGI